MKENKAITLVALIITIIVLLILAVVTISAVNEGSLFSHANNAATTYSEAQKEENTMIANWLTELEKHDKTVSKENVEYYRWVDVRESARYEYIYVVDYDNSLIIGYRGVEGENLQYQGQFNCRIINETFTILLDDTETSITNGVGLEVNMNGHDVIPIFIKDGKLYEGETHEGYNYAEFDSERYYTLVPNFDTSRLVSE